MLKRVDVAVYDITEMFVEGDLEKGSIHTYGVSNDGISLAYNEQMKNIVPVSVYLEIKTIQERIKEGDIQVDSYLE
jgi:basic membrane lipoprotein Med (substrate-binding protein (PBP1-ABC) superfamily)